MAKESMTREEFVKQRLDNMDWKRLEEATGITRESIEKNQFIVDQLVDGKVTHPVYGFTPDVTGDFCLRAVPGANEGDKMVIKAYTISNLPKKDLETGKYPDLPFMGGFITSDAAKEALFERTSWVNKNGQSVNGYANANAGRPVAIMMKNRETGEKEKVNYIVSLHPQSNRLFGIPQEALKNVLKAGDSRSKIYGVQLPDDQLESLANGKAVYRTDWKGPNESTFAAAVQFNACERQLVICHPTALKKAIEMGAVEAPKTAEKPAEAVQEAAVQSRNHGRNNANKPATEKPEVNKPHGQSLI